ncbi:hypothetical protein VKT23_003153 [Stygiomarasmius scandens]|uniref:Mitochondrial import inner membrane translocase subunit Tim21 n=1 Tax=Marasmiellus scandens TaxID=2682957 RepID=A0ABR1K214_9AGAR
MSLLFRAHSCLASSVPRSLAKSRLSVIFVARSYATHRDAASSSTLSSSLDTKHHTSRPESIGPFPIGVTPSSFGTENVKKWSELSTGGKIKRTTARTSNLAVIALGAGLSAVLIYCLTSELFSKNSPTVLYSDACERIKSSPQVAKYLHGPLAFHTSPPSLERPRHRNHQVSSQIFVDSYGREHMIMNFYIQGREPGAHYESSDSYADAVTKWMHEKASHLSDTSYDEAVEWTKERSMHLWDKFHRSFKYLIGAPVPPPSTMDSPSVSEEHKNEKSNTWQWTGLFSSLRKSRGSGSETAPESSGKIYTDGEVHADFIRNNDGYFVCRYLLVDIPNSRSRNPIRVFVDRAPGVKENEPVLRWRS